MPDGVIADLDFSPPPAGSWSFSDKTFTFTPAPGDVRQTFTLTFIAANGYGDTEGGFSVAVTESEGPGWNDFEKFLLQHNLTPGDPGCASQNVWADGETAESYQTDDFDEDGFPNWDEFNAGPQTNPYDRKSHP